MKRHMGTAALLLLTALGSAQENYKTNWTGHRVVGVGGQGAGLSGDVLNFPILVRLGAKDSAVFAASKQGGADLRFTKSDSVTRLKHEIEHWDSAGRMASVWVKVDTVYAAANTRLVMHWGNASAMDSSKGSAVFDTANGFRAVWHMGADSTAGETDATGNGFTAVPNSNPGQGDGVIGRARSFAGGGSEALNDYFDVPNSGTGKLAFPARSRYTISAWANAATVGPRRTIIAKHDMKFALQLNASSRWEGFEYNNNLSLLPSPPAAGVWGWQAAAPTTGAAATGWHHVVTVHDSMAHHIYVNGALLASNLGMTTEGYAGAGNTASVDTMIYRIGKQPEKQMATSSGTGGNNPRFWNGQLDEVRIAAGVRDSNWIKLEYANQRAGGTLVAVQPANVYYVMPGTGNTPRDTMSFMTGVAVNLPLNYTGGPVDSIVVTTGTLPAGLTIDKATGLLSGTPTTAAAAGNRTLTLYSAAGNVTRGLRIAVLEGPTANLHYSPDTVTYPAGLEISNSPTWSGRAPTAFTVTPGLPAGLTFNATTGVISGTATAAVAANDYVVKAMNATDTATATLRITIGAAENFSEWGQHTDWWTNTQGNGAGVGKTVTNFPVLIRLDSANFNAGFAQSVGRGADIRFTKADNTTRLPHQIDTWDSAGRKASIWVLVDTLPGMAIKAFRMHWAKSGAANTSSGASVFKTANGFQAVWHMNGETASSSEPEATANNFTATPSGNPAPAMGAVGGARTLNGTSTYFTTSNTASGPLNFPVNGNYTISAWVSPTTLASHGVVVSKHDQQYALKLSDGGANWEFFEYSGGAWNVVNAAPIEGAWQHVMGVRMGADAAFYLNGARADFGMTPASGGNGEPTTTTNLTIGRQNESSNRYFNGLVDEIRLASVARDTAWAKLEYQNQKPGQTLVAFAQPVGINGAAARAEGYGFSAKALGEGLMFRIQAGSAARVRVTLTDMSGRPVWSRTATAAEAGALAWNGHGNSGSRVAPGVYGLRVSFLDASNKVLHVLDRRIPYTR